MPLMSLPNTHVAVLKNVLPGVFDGTLLRTTVIWMMICCPAGMMGKLLKVSTPPTLENECGTGAPVLFQKATWPTYLSDAPVALRSSVMVMLCKSFGEPWLLMTIPDPGSNITGIVRE